jgi:hypothetical protein
VGILDKNMQSGNTHFRGRRLRRKLFEIQTQAMERTIKMAILASRFYCWDHINGRGAYRIWYEMINFGRTSVIPVNLRVISFLLSLVLSLR